MKKFALLALGLALSTTTVFADDACPKGGRLELYACRSPMMEGGYGVQILRTACGLRAEIYTTVVGGRRALAKTIAVKQVKVPAHVLGAPATFRGKNFELTIHVDGTQVPGGHQADLVTELNSEKINERVVCETVR